MDMGLQYYFEKHVYQWSLELLYTFGVYVGHPRNGVDGFDTWKQPTRKIARNTHLFPTEELSSETTGVVSVSVGVDFIYKDMTHMVKILQKYRVTRYNALSGYYI